MQTKPEVDTEFVLNIDATHLRYAIECLDFAQLKGEIFCLLNCCSYLYFQIYS